MVEPAKEMPVFISFATPDQTIAGTVCSALEQNGIACWVSWRNIALGEDFPTRLLHAIRASRVVVLVFSKAACNSPFIAREIQIALENGKTIIPFRIEDVQPERSLGFHLAGVQWLDAFLPPLEGHLKKLVEQVAAVLEKPILGQVVVPKKKKRGLVATYVAVAALAAVAVFLSLKFYLLRPPQPPSDDSIHAAIAAKLHEAFDARGVAIDCMACAVNQPHLNVMVGGGIVSLTGTAAAADVAAVHGLPLQLPGVKSIDYSVSVAAPLSPVIKVPEGRGRVAGGGGTTAAVGNGKEAAPERVPLTADQLRASAFILRGKEALKQGNFVSAENQFQAALNLDPENTEANAGLSDARKMRDKANY